MSKELLKSVDGLVLLCSFSGNFFILVMNTFSLIKTKSLNLSDQLTSGTSLFEALYEVLKACGYIFEIPTINIQGDPRVSLVVVLNILSFSFWFSTWLCVNFCLKIVKLNVRFYIYLQKTFSKNIVWLLVLCVLVSSLLSFAVGFGVAVEPFLNSSVGFLHGNKSFASVPNIQCPLVCQVFISEFLLGFLLSSTSLVAIIVSLHKHMKKMQSAASRFRSSNINVHVRAIRTISFLLLGNGLFFSSVLMTLLRGTDMTWKYYISILTSACHVLNAVNGIQGNSKLAQPIGNLFGLLNRKK